MLLWLLSRELAICFWTSSSLHLERILLMNLHHWRRWAERRVYVMNLLHASHLQVNVQAGLLWSKLRGLFLRAAAATTAWSHRSRVRSLLLHTGVMRATWVRTRSSGSLLRLIRYCSRWWCRYCELNEFFFLRGSGGGYCRGLLLFLETDAAWVDIFKGLFILTHTIYECVD